jgi:serine/threonine protein phosphatase PrpC
MRIEHSARSITGRRSNNEDAYAAEPDIGFFAVADGMGGYEGGEIASRTALDTLVAYFERVERMDLVDDPSAAMHQMRMAIRMADREVQRRAVGDLAEMGTTVACVLVRGDRALLAHVGDSRIYRLRGEELSLLTRDHSLVAEMEAAGLNAAAHLYHVITQSLGQGPDARPDLRIVEVLPGDRFLLCSDGLTDVLDGDAIADGLAQRRRPAGALVDSAYAMGSHDNITAVVVSALA